MTVRRATARAAKARSGAPARPRTKTGARDGSDRWGLAGLPGAHPAPMADWIAPELATLVSEAPRGEQWLHEIKFDGYRIQARIEGGRATLLSRNRKDWTATFGAIARAAVTLPVRAAILDGEVVVLREDGTTSFQDLQNVLGRAGRKELSYFVFDLLHLDGVDLTGVALEHRKRVLARLIAASDTGGVVQYSDHVRGSGRELFEQACRHSLEGIISKRADGPHAGGRTRDWLKTKCTQGQEFVVGGWSDGSGSRSGFGSLLLGVHEGEGLRYVGRVGTGFSEASLRDISTRLAEIAADTMPFVLVPTASRRGVHWVRPSLVAEVEFLGWTNDGHLRHPSFRGLRDDRAPSEIVRERPADDRAAHLPAPRSRKPASRSPRSARTSASAASTRRAPSRPRADSGASAQVAGVRISHPDKVLYPDCGLTKLELARYYEMVAPWMLPQVTGRPLTMLRCPNGFDAGCFFQKNAEGTPEETVRRVRIPDLKGEVDSTYITVDSPEGIVSLLQMGVLEFHIWGSRAETLELPDRITFDLDPGPNVKWPAVIDGAKLLRRNLQQLGLESLVMTTGGKGLHVVAPLLPELGWPEVKSFTHSLVQACVKLEPRRYTAHLAKARREGVIFLDYLRNGRGATAVAPYSTRARAGAPVAVPIAWDELTARLKPDQWTVRNIVARLKSMKKDPWQRAALKPQSLAAVMEAARGAVTTSKAAKAR